MQSQRLAHLRNSIVPFAAGLFALKQAAKQNQTQNECGGILAYIGKPTEGNRSFDGISFTQTFASFLTK